MGDILIIFSMAFILILIFAVIVFSANANKGDAVKDDRVNAIQTLRDIECFKLEYQNRDRILKESVKLIETTNNLEVLLSRYIDAVNEFEWMEEQQKRGMPITLQAEKCGFRASLNRVANFHIVRIANFQFDKFKTEISTLTMQKAIDRRFEVICELIEKCLSSLKDHDNKFEARDELNSLRLNIETLRKSN